MGWEVGREWEMVLVCKKKKELFLIKKNGKKKVIQSFG